MKRDIVYYLGGDSKSFLELLDGINKKYSWGMNIKNEGLCGIDIELGNQLLGRIELKSYLVIQTENLRKKGDVKKGIKNLLTIADAFPEQPRNRLFSKFKF